ncbi:MAG: DUF1570 domain-containing protein [Phycisphaeraceae bacterium JB051]
MTYPAPTSSKSKPFVLNIATGIFNGLSLLAILLLCGCQTTPTRDRDFLFTPSPHAKSILHNTLLDIQLGDAGYFQHADAQRISEIVEQTRADLTDANLITEYKKSWLILWHHPDSPEGRQLLTGTKRDPAMRGITYYPKRTILLVGDPTPSSSSRWQQIIRHESVHAMMFDAYGQQAIDWPWWLSEGIATLWEIPPVNGQPAINPWRMPMLQYLDRNHQPLLSNHLFQSNGRVSANTLAKDYARAWALVYCLYQNHPNTLKQIIRDASDTIDQTMKHTLQQQIKRLSQNTQVKMQGG